MPRSEDKTIRLTKEMGREDRAQEGAKERPILFSGPLVRALLAGEKTQTRRVITTKGAQSPSIAYWRPAEQPENAGRWVASDGLPIRHIACPYGVPGDRLWVRETFRTGNSDEAESLYYRADEEWNTGAGWHPSIFMPRWASRLTLEVTDVRVQRVQEIEPWDAWNEGIRFPRCACEICAHSATMCTADAGVACEQFMRLWDSINAARGYGWASNPWVWVVSFKRVRP
jgi:hypothetical protein